MKIKRTFALTDRLKGGLIAERVLARFGDELETRVDVLDGLLGLFCGSHLRIYFFYGERIYENLEQIAGGVGFTPASCLYVRDCTSDA